MNQWQWMLRQLGHQLWLRAGLFCLAGVVTALITLPLRRVIPDYVVKVIGAESVDGILEILASSMLAVTTFSLSTMVSAYAAATNNVTPRSTQLIIEDNVAQNALSIFIGSFLFSLVGLVALTMGVYDESGRVILFLATMVVILVIVGALLRWISHLSKLGQVSHTIDKVEKATSHALQERIEQPCFGCLPLKKFEARDDMQPLTDPRIGYIQNVDIQVLADLSENQAVEIYVMSNPGSFNDGVHPLAYSSKALGEESRNSLCKAFTIDNNRSFDQDPRFGVIVLGEIASRALSPGMNDAGTAIDILGTTVRVLAPWVSRDPDTGEVLHGRVHMPGINTAELFEDVFTPIARDGAGILSVGIRLQKALSSLALMGDEETRGLARKHSQTALEHSLRTLQVESERRHLQEVAGACFP